MRFRKYHAIGNDYLVLESDPEAVTPELARRVCDRHRGVGGDGVLVEVPAADADAGVRILNPDGSEAETSGNGVRIFARYLYDVGRVAAAPFSVRTGAGVALCAVSDDGRWVRVEMGRARFGLGAPRPLGSDAEPVDAPLGAGFPDGWRFTAVSMGNPHAVVHVDAATPDLARRWGPTIERDPRFPARTNVQFVQVLAPDRLRVEVWERGAGYTLASGSSACAAAAASRALGRCGPDVTASMPGGDLRIEVGPDFAVTQAGPVAAIAGGALAAEFLAP